MVNGEVKGNEGRRSRRIKGKLWQESRENEVFMSEEKLEKIIRGK